MYTAILQALTKLLDVKEIFVRDRHVWSIEKGATTPIRFASLSDGYLTTAGWFLDLLARWIVFHRALRLLQPRQPFVALSYDALRTLVPDTRLAPWGDRWPAPEEVARIATAARRNRRSTARRRTTP